MRKGIQGWFKQLQMRMRDVKNAQGTIIDRDDDDLLPETGVDNPFAMAAILGSPLL